MTPKTLPTITFVTPRYGEEVIGGAEAGARSLATNMAADGWDIRVITTCAISSVTWADSYPAGTTTLDGVEVQRHHVRRPRDAKFDSMSAEVLATPAAVDRSVALDWIDRQGPDSPDLLEAVSAVDKGVLAFYPYLYQPTVRGIPLSKVPTILHAAAHPEQPFLLPIFDDVLTGVSGHAFHSRSEQELVGRRCPATAALPQVVLGLPIASPSPELISEEAAASVRSSLGIGDEPLVVYLGRVDRGKGTDELVSSFSKFSELSSSNAAARLVVAGTVVHAPPKAKGVEVLGQISDEFKWGLLAAADVLVNPSPHESFSLVLFEAWMAGTPVLVNGLSAPMVEHCVSSGGGLWYRGALNLTVALDRLLSDPKARVRLAAAGKRHALTTAAWPAVRSRYESLLSRLG